MRGHTVLMFPLSLFLALAASSCGSQSVNETTAPPEGTVPVALEPVAEGLAFPLYLTAPPGDPRLFVVEKGGAIRIIKDGALLAAPFLDIHEQVSNGGEQGVLGLVGVGEQAVVAGCLTILARAFSAMVIGARVRIKMADFECESCKRRKSAWIFDETS